MTNTKATTVRWDPAVLQRLRAFADERRQSVNAAANWLVEKGLDELAPELAPAHPSWCKCGHEGCPSSQK